MKLTYEGLKNRKSWEEQGFILPEFDPEIIARKTAETPEWVHFGAGNIFRAYLANVAGRAINAGKLKTGIIAVEGYDPEIITKTYRPHDNLSVYLTWSSKKPVKTVIGSVSDSLLLSDDKLSGIFTAPSLKMVTFTITEKGYAPRTDNNLFHAVSALLYKRFLTGFPLAMVSADNCSDNGEKLKNCIRIFAEAWEKNGSSKVGFVKYIDEKISFPQTMIDKITPRPNPEFLSLLSDIEDIAPILTAKNTYIAPFVNAEETEYFIVEDNFPNGKLPLEDFGVIYTDKETVKKVEKMKVSALLNPIHTCLALFGCLLSYTKISDEMKDPDLLLLVENLSYNECLPTVSDPVIINPREFAETVINVRLKNSSLPDSPQRIASDTSQKLAVRFGETVKYYLKNGDVESLKFIPLVYAGFLRYLTAVDDNGNAFELSPDPLADYLRGSTPEELLSNENIFGLDLTKTPLYDKIIAYYKSMCKGKNAVRDTIKGVNNEEILV
ncbi:MAG: mannitol dehydrogenase family protein [Ruminococcus sp.]|nr:mannitol dehydrogenase family protein [Ruminococcus sp.]